jgi:hypothetical protein
MIGGGGFVPDLGFDCISKMKATQMTRIAASACWPHSRLGPSVIDLTGQAPGNKKITNPTAGVKSGIRNSLCRFHPTKEEHAQRGDSLGGRVG